MGLHVLVAGGGLGGLCLAQALHRDGIGVAVYEREAAADTAQGYRIHVNQQGSGALHACLPPGRWDAFVSAAGRPCEGLGFVTEQMRELLFIEQRRIEGKSPNAPFDPVTSEHPISRVALRGVLLGGLGEVVHFGKELVRYEVDRDHVVAHFADGTTARGDVLVAADGIGSRVRQHYLPHARIVDTGIVAVGGQLPVDAAARAWLPRAFLHCLNNVIPPRRCGMFIAPYVRARAASAGARLSAPAREAGLTDGLRDHVFWAFVAKEDAYGARPQAERLKGAALQARILGMIGEWHPSLVRLVRESAPETVAPFRVQSSEPVARWQTTRVVLLGDAIHAMTPLQGLGGNTAFRDAELLGRRLREVSRGERELLAGLRMYEEEMIGYAFEAVRRSRRIGELAVSEGAIGRAAFKAILRVADGIPPLKRRMFGARTSRPEGSSPGGGAA